MEKQVLADANHPTIPLPGYLTKVVSMESEKESPEVAIFDVIAKELPGEDEKGTNAKLKRKFKRSNFGPVDQALVDTVRKLHNELKQEIRMAESSLYYHANNDAFASPSHFDVDRLVRDTHHRYPSMSTDALYQLANFAIYLYYLR
jgi:hypothetical protein